MRTLIVTLRGSDINLILTPVTQKLGSISGLERSSGEGNGYLLQYSCLENSMDREAWQATVHEVAMSWAQLTDTLFSLKNAVVMEF